MNIQIPAFLCVGILSSYGEMKHMRSGNAEFVPFDPKAKQPKMSYKVAVFTLTASCPQVAACAQDDVLNAPCS